MDFSLREIAKYVRNLRIVLPGGNNYARSKNSYAASLTFSYFLPILIGLKIKSIDLYNSVISGRSYDVVVEIFKMFNDSTLHKLMHADNIYIESESYTVDQFVKEICDALFVNDYKKNSFIQKGIYEFDGELKSDFLDSIDMLSIIVDERNI